MSTEIKKYGFYAYVKGLEKGLGIVVLDIGKNITGAKLHVGKTESFSIPKESFETLLAYNTLEFVEIVPKFVWKEMKRSLAK